MRWPRSSAVGCVCRALAMGAIQGSFNLRLSRALFALKRVNLNQSQPTKTQTKTQTQTPALPANGRTFHSSFGANLALETGCTFTSAALRYPTLEFIEILMEILMNSRLASAHLSSAQLILCLCLCLRLFLPPRRSHLFDFGAA